MRPGPLPRLLPVLLALLPAPAAAGPVVSADPVARMAGIVGEYCANPRYEDGWLQKSDLNGDGLADMVIRYKLGCYDLPAPFCGPSGCMTELWYGLPGGRWQLVMRVNMLGIEPVRFKEVPAVRIATIGLACGRTHGEICESIHTFSGGDFLTLWTSYDAK